MANELKFGSKVVFLNGQPLTLPISASDPGSPAAGDVYYNSVSNTIRFYNGTTWSSISSGGTVTSVALADGDGTSIFDFSGSPITTSGTISISLADQSANMVLAGPTSGGAAEPSFRSLVAADIPSLSYANQSLSNLTSTSVNQDLIPSAVTKKLGSAASYWAALYSSLIKDSSDVSSIDVFNRTLLDASAAIAVNWASRLLKNSGGSTLADWSGSVLKANAGVDFNSSKGINLLDPTSAQDAATKAYVDSQISSSALPQDQIRWVSKDGNDGTGNGSVEKPYLTVKAASDAISDNAQSKEYNIMIGPGIYTIPSDMVFKPWINFVGSVPMDVEVSGSFDHTKLIWSGFDITISLSDAAIRFRDLVLESSDKVTVTNTDNGVQAFLTFSNCENRHNIEVIKNGAGGPFLELNEGYMLGNITDSGSGSGGWVQMWLQLFVGNITVTDLGVYILQGSDMYGSIDISSSNINPTVQVGQSTYQSLTANNGAIVILAGASNQGSDTIAGNGSLTTVGTVTVNSDMQSLPKQANISFSGGTTFNRSSDNFGLTISRNQPMSSFKLTGLSAGTTAGDSVRYEQAILISGANAFAANQPMGGFKLTGLSAGTTAGDSVRYEQAILISGANAFAANQPMGGFKLTGLSAGTTAGDSVRYEQAILTSGVNAFGANQSMGGFKLTNLADPTTGTDAVNVNYLSARLNGLKPKQSVRVATTVAGTLASSFENGDSIDSVTLATNDRILIKDQSSAAENGIYTVNASGSPTRATDFDSLSPIDEINGAWVAVQEGTVSAGKVYVQYGTVAVLDTDPINFEYFNPIASLIGGDMITFSGSTFSVDLATASGLESTNPGNAAGQLRIKLEASNPSLKFTGSNELAANLDPAGAIASGASGLAVQVDNSTIEISSNALRVKAGGISNTHINASAAIAYSKLAALTANRALQSDGSGFVSASSVTNTELGYLSGVTSAIQTQLNGKASTALSNLASVAINASLISDTDNTYDLGSDAVEWKDAWVYSLKHNSAGTPALNIMTTGNNGSLILTANGTGNLDVKSTKLRRSESGASSNFMEDQYFDSLSLSANISSATEISSSLSFAVASFDSAIINYKISEATSGKVRVGQFIVTSDGSVTSSSDQFSETAVLGNATGLSLSADLSGGNVRILYNNTHATNAATMRAQIRRLRA